jgi:hypothetical protein
MRLIKLAIISFLFLFLLVTVISLFIPSHIRISKAINTSAAEAVVIEYISQPKDWIRWHPALINLPVNEYTITKEGDVEVKGTSIRKMGQQNGEVVTELKNENGRPVINGMKLIHHPQSDSLTLQWYMDFHVRWYPWEKFKSLFYEGIYGVQMEQGLASLKELLEQRRSSIK